MPIDAAFDEPVAVMRMLWLGLHRMVGGTLLLVGLVASAVPLIDDPRPSIPTLRKLQFLLGDARVLAYRDDGPGMRRFAGALRARIMRVCP